MDNSPPSFSPTSLKVSIERHRIRGVGGERADAVRLEHLFGVAVVGGDEADAARSPGRLDDDAETSSVTSTAFVTAGIEPVWPTMSGFAKLITAKR